MKQFMKNRKAIAFVLLIAMMFSIMPTAVWAETTDNNPDTTTAYVTIVDQGKIVMAHQKVTVTTSSAIIDDFLREAHNDAYIGGVEAGYNSYTGEYGLSLGKLWGDTSGAFGYRVNDASAWSLADSVKDGDHIVAFVYSDQNNYSDAYSYFNTDAAVTENGLELELELTVSGYDENWNMVFTPLEGAVITIDEKATDYTTNENGKAVISFPALSQYDENWNLLPETHIVSAIAPTGITIVPPVCEVTVKPYLAEEDIAANETAGNASKVSAALSAIQPNSPFVVKSNDNLLNTITSLVNDAEVVITFDAVSDIIDGNGVIIADSEKGAYSVPFQLTCGNVTKTIDVPIIVNGLLADSDTLLKKIAAGYTAADNKWNVMDMGTYTRLYGTSSLTAAAKQNYINTVIENVQKGTYSESDYATAVILPLTSIGVDASRLYPVNSNTPVNALTKLANTTPYISEWSTPYTLMAYKQGYGAGANEKELLTGLLALQKSDGGWGSVDPTGETLAALAFYKGDEDVDTAIKEAVDYLEAQMRTDGVYTDGWNGYNANSTAMAVIGLAAVYDTLDSDEKAVFDKSVEGLLSFAVNDNSGFWKAPNVTTVNAKATEQGFRALLAASQVMKNNDTAFNVYDFSANSLVPGRATGTGEVSKPSTPSGSSNVTVTVSIKGLDGYWLKDKSVTLKDDATMYWALVDAIKGSGITQTGAENGYVSEMSNGKTTLAEFDYGRNSGWLYKVNNTLPEVGLLQYTVKNGDKIEWYYTRDWTTDSLAGSRVNDTDKKAAASVDELLDKLLKDLGSLDNLTADDAEAVAQIRKAYDALTDEQKALVKGYDDLVAAEAMLEALLGETEELPFADIENHWAGNSIRFVYENGLMRGVSDTDFAPDATFSRAMLVAVLHRMAGEPSVYGKYPFDDVRDTAWYANPVAWAYQNKLAGGMTETQYAPNAPITREQLAVMLMRFAQYMDYDTADTIRLVHYKDAGSVSGYAEGAVKWAVANGILKGRNLNELAPQGTATRAEVAVMLERFVNLYTADKQA